MILPLSAFSAYTQPTSTEYQKTCVMYYRELRVHRYNVSELKRIAEQVFTLAPCNHELDEPIARDDHLLCLTWSVKKSFGCSRPEDHATVASFFQRLLAPDFMGVSDTKLKNHVGICEAYVVFAPGHKAIDESWKSAFYTSIKNDLYLDHDEWARVTGVVIHPTWVNEVDVVGTTHYCPDMYSMCGELRAAYTNKDRVLQAALKTKLANPKA